MKFGSFPSQWLFCTNWPKYCGEAFVHDNKVIKSSHYEKNVLKRPKFVIFEYCALWPCKFIYATYPPHKNFILAPNWSFENLQKSSWTIKKILKFCFWPLTKKLNACKWMLKLTASRFSILSQSTFSCSYYYLVESFWNISHVFSSCHP